MIKKQKWAVIDIGSQSLRLLVAEKVNSSWRAVGRKLLPTRLSQGLREDGRLQDRPLERSIEGVATLVSAAARLGACRVLILGTGALRDARNSSRFITEVKQRTGLHVTLLTAMEEASLSHLGACISLNLQPEGAVVFDLGGRTLEIMWGSAGWTSLPLGAVRLTEQFIAHDPPAPGELSRLKQHIVGYLQQLPAGLNAQYARLAGVGGTATSLAAVHLSLESYDPRRVAGTVLSRSAVEALLAGFCRQTEKQRRLVAGLAPSRADIIIAGTVVVLCLLTSMHYPAYTASEGDLMLGALYSRKFAERADRL